MAVVKCNCFISRCCETSSQLANSIRVVTNHVFYFSECSFLLLQDKLQGILFSSKAYKINSKRMEQLWNDCGDAMYSLTSKTQQLGFGQQVRF